MKRMLIVISVFLSLLVSCSIFNPPQKAKVIIISGQSNATGNAWNMYLSQEEQQKYTRGFDNIFINAWNSLTENNTEYFTPVTFGWGENKGIRLFLTGSGEISAREDFSMRTYCSLGASPLPVALNIETNRPSLG